MLLEYLQKTDPSIETEWHTVMPGVKVCRFSVEQTKNGFPIILSPKLEPLHFETLFCLRGSLMLGRKRGNPLTAGRQEILFLSDDDFISSARIAAPMEGILVAVDGAEAENSLKTLRELLGDLNLYTSQVKELMTEKNGYALLQGTSWNRTVFMALEGLDGTEKSRYCVLKTLELLYLLCTESTLLESGSSSGCPDSYLTRTVTEMQVYMEGHLDEKLTIEAMSHKFHISPTAFKSCFRRLYGQPVHSWLQAQRMKQAAEFLYSSPMTILQIAQAVGYEGVSQFNVAFKRQYGVTPGQYRKMSNTGEI